MSYERDLSEARNVDDFRLRIKVLKEIVESNFYDPMFGVITNRAVIEELRGLLDHFGIR